MYRKSESKGWNHGRRRYYDYRCNQQRNRAGYGSKCKWKPKRNGNYKNQKGKIKI